MNSTLLSLTPFEWGVALAIPLIWALWSYLETLGIMPMKVEFGLRRWRWIVGLLVAWVVFRSYGLHAQDIIMPGVYDTNAQTFSYNGGTANSTTSPVGAFLLGMALMMGIGFVGWGLRMVKMIGGHREYPS